MKKLVAVLLAGAMCFSLAACGSGTADETVTSDAEVAVEETTDETEAAEDETAAADTEEAADTAAAGEVTTATEGVLTMGTNAAFPPYEYYEGDAIVGIDAEVAQAIAEKLGLTLEIVDMDFGSIITAVQTGKVDVGIAGMTVEPDRLENVDFTDSYATGVQVVIVPEGSEIASVDDLEGKLIGVQESTTGWQYCTEDYGDENVIPYPNGATAVQALMDGKVDCVVIDQQPALSFVEANEGLTILDTEYAVEDYAIAVSKDNTGLKDAINTALNELIEDGTVQGILDKYISAE
ncbi:ABC transporter substrate-binding protein [Lachnoclostridium sp. An131]|uniref:ABC transporter substrate-binding protein n=1 Tax=Lachnoclostridium sp. An131 TaxID=1965555 RepID=UPI000B39820D|nr:ABC transporter substrate-binding protein [Lachnoclostridium sp. An131]OUQ23353.1 ABC transporter substrate-binding protein [Lachnoclostridium sp. An131]